jgi:hypothetical protein
MRLARFTNVSVSTEPLGRIVRAQMQAGRLLVFVRSGSEFGATSRVFGRFGQPAPRC